MVASDETVSELSIVPKRAATRGLLAGAEAGKDLLGHTVKDAGLHHEASCYGSGRGCGDWVLPEVAAPPLPV